MNTNVVPLKSGGKVNGIIPQSVEEVFRLAQAVSKSGLAPKGMNTPEQITVAILHGAELGLPPMQAVQRIAVVNGRPTVWGDAIPALLWGAGFKLREWVEGTDQERAALCEVTRPTGEKITGRFSVSSAKKAGLWGKPGPWTQYPDRMLAMRARGFAARDGAADVLGGLYLREEIDEDMRDVTPNAGPPRRNASQTKKSGDMQRFETECRACTTTDELSAKLEEWKPTLQTMPESWEQQASEFVAALRERLSATVVEPETQPDDREQRLLDTIQARYNQCDSEQEVAALLDEYGPAIDDLTPENKAKALAILVVP
jgi:hypothetical protein